MTTKMASLFSQKQQLEHARNNSSTRRVVLLLLLLIQQQQQQQQRQSGNEVVTLSHYSHGSFKMSNFLFFFFSKKHMRFVVMRCRQSVRLKKERTRNESLFYFFGQKKATHTAEVFVCLFNPKLWMDHRSSPSRILFLHSTE